MQEKEGSFPVAISRVSEFGDLISRVCGVPSVTLQSFIYIRFSLFVCLGSLSWIVLTLVCRLRFSTLSESLINFNLQ